MPDIAPLSSGVETSFYVDYSVQVGECVHVSTWDRGVRAAGPG